MSEGKQDRDGIDSSAIVSASGEGRDADLAQARDGDAEPERPVEGRAEAHSQPGRGEEPARTAAGTSPPTDDAPRGALPSSFTHQLWNAARDHRRASAAAAILLLLLLAAAVAGTGQAIWALRKEGQARKAEQEAVAKGEKARDEADEYKSKFHEAAAAGKFAVTELLRARSSEQAEQRSEAETKAILDFFKKTLLSAGRLEGVSLTEAFWARGPGKDVTLSKAVDATESQVAAAFADRPLGEASVREMLGLSDLSLGEPARAVKQYERGLVLRESLQGVDHPDTADCRNQLAVANRLAGRAAEAARLFDRSPFSTAHASALAVHGSMLLLQKNAAEAELKLRECLRTRRKIQPDDWTTFDTMSMLGEALLDQKKFAEAEPLLLQGYEGLKQREDKIPSQDKPHLAKAQERLVNLHESYDAETLAARASPATRPLPGGPARLIREPTEPAPHRTAASRVPDSPPP